MSPSARTADRATIGWREWVELPELVVTAIKAKVDTGARTSALHAFDLRLEQRDGEAWAVFEVHPRQRNAAGAVAVAHRVDSWREVRSSNGERERRPVIRTTVRLGGRTWPIDVTLTARDEMGFRMLLGRAAVRRRFVVDPGRSFLLGKEPPR